LVLLAVLCVAPLVYLLIAEWYLQRRYGSLRASRVS
jgi:hypothetical protein